MHKFLRITVMFVLFFSFTALAYASGAFSEGDQGEEVAAIQSRLNAMGYDAGDADGDFGSQTTKAVIRFQNDRGLEADGVVGAQTYRVLLGREIPVSRDDGSTTLIRRVIQNAMRYRGVPYMFGGTTPNGFDCSGFLQYVFGNSGIRLPRTADAQFEMGRSVSYSRLQPGDLVFFTTYAEGASHSGIYLGNGQFISATSSRGVTVDRIDSGYWGSRYIGARRII